jgi:predicted nucleic acid-binding protein
MGTEVVVVNASPLIALLGIRQEALLPALFGEVQVTQAVLAEVAAGGAKDPSARRLSSLHWLRPVKAVTIPESVQGWGLGRGESEVLAVAAQTPGARAVLDDLAARRCARFLGVEILGTGKVLLLAKQRGLIVSVRAQIEGLLAADFRLSERLIVQLLALSGEAEDGV